MIGFSGVPVISIPVPAVRLATYPPFAAEK
jgi:hypothetical protein